MMANVMVMDSHVAVAAACGKTTVSMRGSGMMDRCVERAVAIRQTLQKLAPGGEACFMEITVLSFNNRQRVTLIKETAFSALILEMVSLRAEAR